MFSFLLLFENHLGGLLSPPHISLGVRAHGGERERNAKLWTELKVPLMLLLDSSVFLLDIGFLLL